MVGAGEEEQDRQQHAEEPVKARSNDPLRNPSVQGGEDRCRRQHETVQSADPVEGCHEALGEPLLRNPRLAGAGTAKRVYLRPRSQEFARVENPLADDAVPKHAGIAEKRALMPCEQQIDPDAEEDAGLRSPEAAQHEERSRSNARSVP